MITIVDIVVEADPGGSLGFGDPLQTVPYSKVSSSNNNYRGA